MKRYRLRRARRRRLAMVLRIAAVGAVVALVLPGCALLEGPIDRAAGRAASAVNAYCDNFTADQRAQFGDRVRQLAAPDAVAVTCN